jgi:hypothetical protein
VKLSSRLVLELSSRLVLELSSRLVLDLSSRLVLDLPNVVSSVGDVLHQLKAVGNSKK